MPLSIRKNLASSKHLLRCHEIYSPLLAEKEKRLSDGPKSFFSRVKEAAKLSQLKSVERICYGPPPWQTQLPVIHQWGQDLPTSSSGQDLIQVYTDAARATDGRCSVTFIVKRPSDKDIFEHLCLAGCYSVAKCELIAIYLGTRWVAANIDRGKVMLVCDSQKALQAIASPKVNNSVKNCIVKLWKELKRSVISLCFTWVKAHSGVAGNEQADRAAKIALDLLPTLSCRKDRTDLYDHVEKVHLKLWQSLWDKPKSKSGSFFRAHTPNVSRSASIYGGSRTSVSHASEAGPANAQLPPLPSQKAPNREVQPVFTKRGRISSARFIRLPFLL